MTVAKFVKNPHPFPAFFFSHGGPTFMYEDDPFGNKGAWRTIKKLGAEIKTKWKPDYIIVVSAHWQSVKPKLIEINKVKGKGKGKDNQENELIYDFFGFPSHMYKEEFHTRNDEFIADEIKQKLQANGFDSQVVERGVDHGVWVPLKVAFSDYNTQNTRTQPKDKQLDLECPMIQVSLTSNDHDFKSHYKLGEVLNFFRDNKIWDERQQKYLAGMVICSGMSVHNLRDLGAAMRRPDGLMPYVKPFNKILTDILEKREGGDTLKELTNLQLQPIFRQAHPTFEHFLPVVVASGIANDSKDNIKELYNAETASLGWGIYQVGEAPKASL
ncbi:uncharacterized protein LODBEIA_P57760 [Lodderomyces beijingensis]|uniref:Extradiol ring-cleavage dioxygenase class III enzyme subunit B domain-containing protein n=1 Tax=Lodderomyces beijingensis TaxID=1775926 RepID=A0ABP0ZWK3_9ASCO